MIKPVLKDDIAIYYPEKSLKYEGRKEIEKIFEGSVTTIKGLNVKAAIISFSSITELDDGGITALAKALQKLNDSHEIVTAAIDYKSSDFVLIKEIFAKYSIPLFQTFEAAKLFLNQQKLQHIKNILIYEKDDLLRELISGELSTKGYTIKLINSAEEFEKLSKIKSAGTIFITDTFYDASQNFIQIKPYKGAITYLLPEKVDKRIESYFHLQAHNQKVKDGYKLFIFDCLKVKNINPHGLEYITSLSMQSAKLGIKVAIANLADPLIQNAMKDKMTKAGVLFGTTLDVLLSNPSIKPLIKSQEQGGLTKKLISSLPIFINAAVATFESLTGGSAIKKSHKIDALKIEAKETLVAAELSFDGEISGHLVLIFNESIAKEVAMSLLGDDQCSFEELLDVVKEFSNIITGKAKALLAEQDISTTLSTPKTFKSTAELSKFVGDKKGIDIDMELNGHPVRLFLTY